MQSGMTPFASLSPEHYRPKRVLGGISVPFKLQESTADLHPAGLLPPCHTSSHWEDGSSGRVPD